VRRVFPVSCIALCIAGVAVFSACGGDDDDSSSATTASTPGDPSATAQDLADRQFASTEVTGHELVEGTEVTIGFPNPQQFSANTGCNTMNGQFAIEDGVFVVDGEVQSTLMGCSPELEAQDDWLLGLLVAGPEATFADGTLTLTGPEGVITFETVE
jgi:heat shock protein HslJ